jgi:hypothetical protein
VIGSAWTPVPSHGPHRVVDGISPQGHGDGPPERRLGEPDDLEVWTAFGSQGRGRRDGPGVSRLSLDAALPAHPPKTCRVVNGSGSLGPTASLSRSRLTNQTRPCSSTQSRLALTRPWSIWRLHTHPSNETPANHRAVVVARAPGRRRSSPRAGAQPPNSARSDPTDLMIWWSGLAGFVRLSRQVGSPPPCGRSLIRRIVN